MSLAKLNISHLKQAYLYFATVTAVISILHICPFTGSITETSSISNWFFIIIIFFYFFYHLTSGRIFSSCCSHHVGNESENDFHISQCLCHSFSLSLSLSFYLSIYLSRCQLDSLNLFIQTHTPWWDYESVGDGHVFSRCTDSLRPTEGPFSLSLAPLFRGSVQIGFFKIIVIVLI